MVLTTVVVLGLLTVGMLRSFGTSGMADGSGGGRMKMMDAGDWSHEMDDGV